MADKLVVNSKFTAKVFKKEFTRVWKKPEVLYPAIQVELYEQQPALNAPRVAPLVK